MSLRQCKTIYKDKIPSAAPSSNAQLKIPLKDPKRKNKKKKRNRKKSPKKKNPPLGSPSSTSSNSTQSNNTKSSSQISFPSKTRTSFPIDGE